MAHGNSNKKLVVDTAVESALGTTADVKVTGDTAGSISAKLRGISYFWNLVVDTANSLMHTNIKQFGGNAVVNGGPNGVQSVGGAAAHNTAIGTSAGNAAYPINIGAQAVTSENAAATAARICQLICDAVGKLITLPYCNPENIISGAITSAMTGTTSTSLIGAPGSGLRNYITQITVSNSHATQGSDLAIQDGSGGTTIYTIPAASLYGGASLTFVVALKQPTANTALYCANVTTGASIKVSAVGYKGA